MAQDSGEVQLNDVEEISITCVMILKNTHHCNGKKVITYLNGQCMLTVPSCSLWLHCVGMLLPLALLFNDVMIVLRENCFLLIIQLLDYLPENWLHFKLAISVSVMPLNNSTFACLS